MTSCQRRNNDTTKFCTYFFPFNECSYFDQNTYQSWNECKSSVYEIWPDNTVIWVFILNYFNYFLNYLKLLYRVGKDLDPPPPQSQLQTYQEIYLYIIKISSKSDFDVKFHEPENDYIIIDVSAI